jgi:hypothetical protein
MKNLLLLLLIIGTVFLSGCVGQPKGSVQNPTPVINSKADFLAQFPNPLKETPVLSNEMWAVYPANLTGNPYFSICCNVTVSQIANYWDNALVSCRDGSYEGENKSLIYCFIKSDCAPVSVVKPGGTVISGYQGIVIKAWYNLLGSQVGQVVEGIEQNTTYYNVNLSLIDFNVTVVYGDGEYALSECAGNIVDAENSMHSY